MGDENAKTEVKPGQLWMYNDWFIMPLYCTDERFNEFACWECAGKYTEPNLNYRGIDIWCIPHHHHRFWVLIEDV